MSGWRGVDFDGTLCRHDHNSDEWCGEPVPDMLRRVKEWIAAGVEVRIVTARVGPTVGPRERADNHEAIRAWCVLHLDTELQVTASKDYGMVELWDDRAVQVVRNTGLRADECAADTTAGAIATWISKRECDDLMTAIKRDQLVMAILRGDWKK